MNSINEVSAMSTETLQNRKMANKNGLWSVLFVCLLLFTTAAIADGIQDYVLTKLDGKGSVDSIDATNSKLVVNDRSYTLSRNVTVFDVRNKRNSSVGRIKTGDTVGFRSKPLSSPTAPYDQLIIKLWILK